MTLHSSGGPLLGWVTCCWMVGYDMLAISRFQSLIKAGAPPEREAPGLHRHLPPARDEWFVVNGMVSGMLNGMVNGMLKG